MRNVALAATKLRDILRPKAPGEPVNAHVVPQVPEPQPDFDAMQRVIQQTFPPVSEPSNPARDDDSAR